MISRFTYFFLGITLVLFGITATHHVTGGPGIVGVVMEIVNPNNLLSRNPFVKEPYKAASAAVDASLIAAPVLPEYAESFKLKIRGLLRNEKFEELNEILYGLQQISTPNSTARGQIFIADYAFQLRDDSFEPLLNEWAFYRI
jgi:hypothetical protein